MEQKLFLFCRLDHPCRIECFGVRGHSLQDLRLDLLWKMSCRRQTETASIHTENLVERVFADGMHLEWVHKKLARDGLLTDYTELLCISATRQRRGYGNYSPPA